MKSCKTCVHWNKLESLPLEGVCSNEVVNSYVYNTSESGSQFISDSIFYCRQHKEVEK